MSKGAHRGSSGRSQQIVYSDEDDQQHPMPDETQPPGSPPRTQPSRKTKANADRAWEALKPGKRTKQTKRRAGSSENNMTSASKGKQRKQGSIPSSLRLAAAEFPAPDMEVSEEEPDERRTLRARLQRQSPRCTDVDVDGDAAEDGSDFADQSTARCDAAYSDNDADHEEEEQDDEQEEEPEDLDDEEGDELDEDEGAEDDVDEHNLARQMEAERASWTDGNTDQEDNEDEDEFPNASAFIQPRAKSASSDRQASSPHALHRIKKRSANILSEDEHNSSTSKRVKVARMRTPRVNVEKLRARSALQGAHGNTLAHDECEELSNTPKKHSDTSRAPSKGQQRHSVKSVTRVPVSDSVRSNKTAIISKKRKLDERPREQASTHGKMEQRDTKHRSIKGGPAAKPRKPRQSETPEWVNESDSGALNPPPSAKRARTASDDDDEEQFIVEEKAVIDQEIDLVNPGPKLALGCQHPRVRAVAKAAIDEVQANVCLNNAFPEGPDKHNQFTLPTLVRVAQKLGYPDIARRVQTDMIYSRHLGSIPAQRISTFRGRIKKYTDGVVAETYNLRPGDGHRVDWLDQQLNYIYPHNYKSQKVDRHLPYKPTIFIQVMRSAWFSRPTAYGFAIIERFTSSSLEQPREKEIPAPMLALAATAIYASIVDYSAPVYKARDFTGNEFADTYARNMRALQKIKDHDTNKYHVLMHGFFRSLCGSHVSIASGASGKSVDDLDALDVAGMPDA
ncbi:hypothetical protein C2E23DRAFT_885337 [Lenzites betulinus]|nr:hypothetical protein C2E23DRAFT_885337 [Lenzites betulinus]